MPKQPFWVIHAAALNIGESEFATEPRGCGAGVAEFCRPLLVQGRPDITWLSSLWLVQSLLKALQFLMFVDRKRRLLVIARL